MTRYPVSTRHDPRPHEGPLPAADLLEAALTLASDLDLTSVLQRFVIASAALTSLVGTFHGIAHRLLRRARIQGWRGNHPVTIEGQRYFLDIAFPSLRVVVEIDGRLHEDDTDLFESDRWRQNALVHAGWTVLRFTWRMLDEHPEQALQVVLSFESAEEAAS